MNITVPITVKDERVTDLITSAIEGGSNYWYIIDIERSVLTPTEYLVEQPMAGGNLCIQLLNPEDGPLNGKTEWWLNRSSAESGLVIMATKYPKHFANWLSEDDDAETGDVFLQCALFGEVVFG